MSYKEKVFIKGSRRRVFDAISGHVQEWWGNTDAAVAAIGDVFTTSFGETFWKFEISAFELHTRIVWNCIDARHVHTGYDGIETEWVGTSVEWELEESNHNETLLHFTHHGLVHGLNCYEICFPAWETFVTRSLKTYVETGKGIPYLS